MSLTAEHQFFGHRLKVARLFGIGVLSLLLLRLWYLQGIQGSYFRDLSENNRIRTLRTVAPRGTMYDRDGRILVGNRPAFQIAIITEDVPSVSETLSVLSELTGRPIDSLERQLESQRGRFHFEPRVVIADASREELARVKVNSYRLPGVIIEIQPTRNYPENSVAAQVLGYSREISRTQLEKNQDRGYRRGDTFGQTGLEAEWEAVLRGTAGYRQVEVDAMGHRKGELGEGTGRPGTPGKNLRLSIDIDVQRAAEAALGERRGAVVALDTRNGDVLALASTPTYDANIFSGQLDAQAWKQLTEDSANPLQNRAIAEVFPSGSTFKLITSVAALATGKAAEHTVYNCPGYYSFGRRRWRCHKASGHGSINMRRALTVSCNAYYFRLGHELGIDLIERYSRLLGLGARTGISLPGEVEGIVPSESWKRKALGTPWYPGDTLPVSIGQGYLEVTPLQMALAVTTIANGGTVYQPRLVTAIEDPITKEVETIEPVVIRKTGIPEPVFAAVRSFASDVVNETGGTGRNARLEGIKVGGKTGTAQVRALGKDTQGDRFKDHAWFVSFAPVDNPTIATAVVVLNAGGGGQFAAPVAREVYEAYFRKKGMLVDPAIQADAPSALPPIEEVPSEGVAGVEDAESVTAD